MDPVTLLALGGAAFYLWQQQSGGGGGARGPIHLEDGSLLLPDGRIVRPDGTIVTPGDAQRAQNIARAGQAQGWTAEQVIKQAMSAVSTGSSLYKILQAVLGKGTPATTNQAAETLATSTAESELEVADEIATEAGIEAGVDVSADVGLAAASPAMLETGDISADVAAAAAGDVASAGGAGAGAVASEAALETYVAADVAAAAAGDIATTAAPAVAEGVSTGVAMGVFAAVSIGLTALMNLVMGDGPYWSNTKPGQISKELMLRKQLYIAAHGNEAEVEALKAAPTFAAAIELLAHAPAGTSGQVQWGVGDEYAGETIWASAGTTETPGWAPLVEEIAHPQTILGYPAAVAAFITNLWVQTGPSGAAAFDPGATQTYQAILLSKLTVSPDYVQLAQVLLNRWPIVDPRDQQALAQTISAVPDLPVDGVVLRVGRARLPLDHRWGWYNVYASPPAAEDLPIGQAALQIAAAYESVGFAPQPQNPTLIMDRTTESILSKPVMGSIPITVPGFEGQGVITVGTESAVIGYQLDPAYVDPAGPDTPVAAGFRQAAASARAALEAQAAWTAEHVDMR